MIARFIWAIWANAILICEPIQPLLRLLFLRGILSANPLYDRFSLRGESLYSLLHMYCRLSHLKPIILFMYEHIIFDLLENLIPQLILHILPVRFLLIVLFQFTLVFVDEGWSQRNDNRLCSWIGCIIIIFCC